MVGNCLSLALSYVALSLCFPASVSWMPFNHDVSAMALADYGLSPLKQWTRINPSSSKLFFLGILVTVTKSQLLINTERLSGGMNQDGTSPTAPYHILSLFYFCVHLTGPSHLCSLGGAPELLIWSSPVYELLFAEVNLKFLLYLRFSL